jgi:SAM-dependent methyltransferase
MPDAMRDAEKWGQRPGDWAELAEPSNEPLYARVLDELEVGADTKLLDLACGSGYAARMAARRGASVTGIDVTPELLAIAAGRVPLGRFVAGSMDRLPFADGVFNRATAFNALQFAEDPAVAVREAHRVLRPGGWIGVAGFAEPERNQSTTLHLALEPLRLAAAHQHLPYALASPSGFTELLAAGGFVDARSGEVELSWHHPDVDSAVRAVLASGGGAMAIEGGGEPAARQALERAVEPFVAADGQVDMRNTFRYAIARRPER